MLSKKLEIEKKNRDNFHPSRCRWNSHVDGTVTLLK